MNNERESKQLTIIEEKKDETNNKGKIKEIYFITIYQRQQKEKEEKDFIFNKNYYNIRSIYTRKELIQNQQYLYAKVFKLFWDPDNNKDNIFNISFDIGGYTYTISFNVDDRSFYFDIELTKVIKLLSLFTKKKVEQNSLNYYQKLGLFIEALKQNKEEEKIDNLYEETIKLCTKKNEFCLLIPLFINIYEKKILCLKLMQEFYQMNKYQKKESKLEIKDELKAYASVFSKISAEADITIKNKGYNPILFYGIIFCFFNCYDNENFNKYFRKFYKENSEVLFEILLIYYPSFVNSINQDFEFFEKFIEYTIKNKEFDAFKSSLNYILDIETFINIIDCKKEKIIEKYGKSDIKSIQIKSNLLIYKNEQDKEIKNIFSKIESILNFCEKENILLIYFSSNFWKNILKHYKEPSAINIDICFNLRELLKKYYELINKLFKDSKIDEELKIKNDIKTYVDKDEYANIIDKNIKNYFKIDKEITNEIVIGYIKEKNPFYNEVKYENDIKRDVNIFDFINFNQINKDFIETFKQFEFENIFKEKITNFTKKMISKINNIYIFSDMIDMIDLNKISQDKYYLTNLKLKFDKFVKKIKLSPGKKLDKEIEIIAKFVSYLYRHEKNLDFLVKKVNKLQNEIKILVYKELIIRCEDEIYEPMQDFIFEKYFCNIDNIDNVITLIDRLTKNNNKIKFLNALMKRSLFTKEEYYSNNDSPKIALLCKLYEKRVFEIFNEDIFFGDLENLIINIRNEIEGDIDKKTLEIFLKNDKDVVIMRLGLINIIYKEFNPYTVYDKKIKEIKEINRDIEKLKYFKNSLLIFHRYVYLEKINEITNLIKELQENSIKNYNNTHTKEIIEESYELEQICSKVNLVKDFILFRLIYDETSGNNENIRFEEALTKLDNIKQQIIDNMPAKIIYQKNKKLFDKIKETLSDKESKANQMINQLKNYCEIRKKTTLINDLTIIFKSQKFEMDLKSIIFFFESINPNDKKWNNKIPKGYEAISKMDLEELKKILCELESNGIYNYKEKISYFKLFTSLYEKKEAIDFLLSKSNKDITYLENRIDPIIQNLTIKNIQDTEECIKIISIFKKEKDNFKIFGYIKNLSEEKINKFESYSKNYASIIDLDRNNNIKFNVFEKVDNIIKDKRLVFNQNNDFCCENLEELIHLKNQIYLKQSEEIKEKKNIFQIKCYKLIFFKNIITELEIIYENLKVLRIKGCSLPIEIIIEINYPDKKYLINNKEKNFKEIKDFLFKAKFEQISQLDLVYQKYNYLRFLYGKLFRKIIRHLKNECNVYEIARYILNITGSQDNFVDGEKINPEMVEDYVSDFSSYMLISFNNIFLYLISLFQKNDTSLEKHYENMLIKGQAKYRGFYLYKCEEDESMEEFIINLFFDKINCMPIAQNILFTNEETSFEEIQAFFYRAILCEYNTLFVVEINDSFSEFQQNAVNKNIDTILSSYNKSTKKNNIEKNKDNIYLKLKSCIVFVYKKNNSFINELEKYNVQELGRIEKKKVKNEDKNNILNNNLKKRFCTDFENIKIITSDICGLGKSHKIKKLIREKNKKYYYFPLGGILSKAIIFEKLDRLLKIIKKEHNQKFEDIAIHLDLKESNEISIINEFLFSLLITKFYISSENIIYIPKDIEIYIEISNSFENYFSKLSMLKIFNSENIPIDEVPKLDLPVETIKIFDEVLKINSNQQIAEFIQKYIGIEKYSFHQIQIFIKHFILLFTQLKSKFSPYLENKREIEQYIEEFSKCIKSCTMTRYTQYLIDHCNNKENKDINNYYIDIYENEFNTTKIEIPSIFLGEKKIKENLEETSYNTKFYLEMLKELLDVENEIENEKGDKKSLLSILQYNTQNYIIIDDNFKKMLLLYWKIKANIPVIIMGETGCGKTLLAEKLSQILNNGKMNLKIINIHLGFTDDILYEDMKKINEEAKNLKEEIWILFDDINTCKSFSLLTEIFTNRTFNGQKLSENIRLLATCNPYRKMKPLTDKLGLIRDDEKENELVYLVHPLPQSLLYYVFNFGSINEEDEKKYIYYIIEKLFNEDESKMHEITKDAIFECHKFLRETFDSSIVSLRDISRFSKCVEFFMDYFSKKDEYLSKKIKSKEKLYKIKSIICSIYICYYVRLINVTKRTEFDIRLKEILLKLINFNNIINTKGIEESEEGSLVDKIKNEELKADIRNKKINQFSDFLNTEEDFLINLIKLDKGIGKNSLLKENLFLLFISIITKIPLIIIGKPGTGKSLSAKIICESMKGKYSKNEFFRKYPEIIPTFFQGSESTNPEDIIKLFDRAEGKYNFFNEKLKKNEIRKEDLPISMILFDELGLAENAKANPFKKLNSKIEYSDKALDISFVGISKYPLDPEKLNRFIILSVQDSDEILDRLTYVVQGIVETISEDLFKNQKIVFGIIVKTYYSYKKILLFIKELIVFKQLNLKNNESEEYMKLEKMDFSEIKRMEGFKNLFQKEKRINQDFHGSRDLYYLVKGVANEISKLSSFDQIEVKDIIEKYIERNFGGIDYEIDIDFNIKFNDIIEDIGLLQKIFEDYLSANSSKRKRGQKDKKNEKKEEIIRVSSVFLFKKIFNIECGREVQYIIGNENCKKYDLNKCITDNINDNNDNSRYLLLGIKPSLSSLIYKIIKFLNPTKSPELYEGSSFIDDNSNEYKFKKVNEIKEIAKSDKLIILKNLEQIQPFLYDMYNMVYVKKDGQKCTKICLDNLRKILTPIHDSFRIILLVDREKLEKVEAALLSRFEKMYITFDKLLNEDQLLLTRRIIDKINLEYHIENFLKSNASKYKLKDLLINCGEEEIEGLIYNIDIKLKKEKKINNVYEEEIEEILYNKIINLLPQDIITILPEDHNIRKLYDDKKYTNFQDYISDEDNKFKISIIYTFTSLSTVIAGSNNDMSFMVSEIKDEHQLINKIDELKNVNDSQKHGNEKNNNILIHFEYSSSDKIQFISNLIIKNFNNDNYKYIIIIHVKRNFNPDISKPIYSVPDIDPNINQIFLDNLNSKNIKLLELLEKKISDIMNDHELIDLNKEFKRTLTSFVYRELIERSTITNNPDTNNEKSLLNEENYIDEIINYMDEEEEFKNKIINTTKELIKDDKVAEVECKSLLDKIFKNINKNSIDIISCLLDYIKEKIFSEYLAYIFKALEDNNFLTTLVEIKKNNFDKIDREIINQMEDRLLIEINLTKKAYEPKFSFKFIIPGLYNTYKNISNYISNNINVEFFNNEKNLRNYFGSNSESEITKFHEKEEILLNDVYDEISKDKFIFSIINQISPDLILKDYVTFFLENKIDIFSKTEINNQLIHLLLKLRFSPKNEIIKKHNKDPIKIITMKIMWIESNINYISNILMIFDLAKQLFNGDGKKLYNYIVEIIYNKENEIKYIVNEKRNPEHTREVNECFYILLASICYIITSDEIKLSQTFEDKNKFEIQFYCEILKKINIILQSLNKDLSLFLNEMYIIDELIKVIELENLKNIEIEKIEKIRKLIRKSAEIIQKDRPDKIDDLINNFDAIYRELEISGDEIIQEKNNEYYDAYYNTLRYIYYKEINKVRDEKYRVKILEYLIKEKEIVKKSSSIFQILLKKYFKTTKDFKAARKNLLEKNDKYIKLINENISDGQQPYYFALTETLLYFFEKNSIIYFNNIFYSLKEEKEGILMEKEPMSIFKDCISYLQDFADNKTRKYDKNNKYVARFFCLGYIRIFIYIFIKMFDDDDAKFKEPEKIIEIINENKTINHMIQIYIYKILFNKHGIDAFINKNYILKYKLEEYNDFKEFLKLPDDEQIDLGFETLDNNNYESIYKKLEKKKKEKFKNKIKNEEIDKNLHIDNFYIAASNLLLLRLKREDFEDSEIYSNFYENICKPLYNKFNNNDNNDENNDNKYSVILEILFNPKKYREIKQKYGINSSNIEAILYSYRYCVNELLADDIDDINNDNRNLFLSFYDKGKIDYLAEKYYPGSDTRDEPYFELYSQAQNHLIEMPSDICYLCLSKKGFYQPVPSNFIEEKEMNKECSNCGEKIGAISKEIVTENGTKTTKEIVKNGNHYMVFKDKKEIDKLINNKDKKDNLEKINYMDLKEFEDKFITPLYEKKKGLLANFDKKYYLRKKKYIRGLSRISYSLLNYILYSHLFFARIFTNSENFDRYKPKDMSWGEIINESFNLLKKELSSKGIDSFEIFMNYTFKELFEKLHEKEIIDAYEELKDFEKDLENLIQEKIVKSLEEIKKYNEIIEKNSIDNNSSINLLKEKFEKSEYRTEEYPCYEYFYYSYYLDENYFNNNNSKAYPLLNKYLNYKKNKKNEENKYSLDKFYLFNKALNIISEKYSHKITREYAEKTLLKDTEIYQIAENSKTIDRFIKFYNSLKIVNSEGKEIKLNVDKNTLSDFVIDEKNEIGKTYKNIYKMFIQKQNNEIKDLLDIKFDSSFKYKIYAQQIKEDEIFTFNKFSFTDVIFNSSYRKIIDTQNYHDYSSYEIDISAIEENMTELLLKNKKLLDEDIIIDFSYNNYIFDYQLNNLITTFKKNYKDKDISFDDKEIINNFIKENEGNLDKYLQIINDFMTLMEYLNEIKKNKKENDMNIKGSSKIYDILKNINSNVSNEFLTIFDAKTITVHKIANIFNYYLLLIFNDIKAEIKNYQEKAEFEIENEFQLDEESLHRLNEYFQKEVVVNKEELKNAIRIFITLVLFREKDKENKIQLNRKNIVDYLNSPDLWKNKVYEREEFYENLTQFKLCNIQINQIVFLYDYLKDREDEGETIN